jgi:hypothetical protein
MIGIKYKFYIHTGYKNKKIVLKLLYNITLEISLVNNIALKCNKTEYI